MILLSTMMIPWDVTMIPQYMEFKIFGWINTLKPLIIPAWFGSAYYIFLMRQFLMGVPKDFEEAARIDGASRVRIFFKITLPLIWPTVRTTLVFFILSTMNMSFQFVTVMTNGEPQGHSEVLLSYVNKQAFSNANFGYPVTQRSGADCQERQLIEGRNQNE